MLDPNPSPQPSLSETTSRCRLALLRRLADVVCLPSSRINGFERAVTGDLMVEVLREASVQERRRVAERMAHLSEIPNTLLRLLLNDDPYVAEPLISLSLGLTDADLVSCAQTTTKAHRELIALRRGLSEIVCETLMRFGEVDIILTVLRNTSSQISQTALEGAVALSRNEPSLRAPLLRRPEIKPSSAYVMYWWSSPEQRMAILQRFAVSRAPLQESVEDVFALAAQDDWSDPIVRKTLQFIERRQRNRAALQRSSFASLEEAVAAAGSGMTRDLLKEIAHLSGIKPITCAKILSDGFGDPLAILCKATGLSREALHQLWLSMKRPELDENGDAHPAWERTQVCYEMLAVDRAQTVLRYWNWALSSALTPALVRAIREGEEQLIDEYSVPERAAKLALAKNYDR